MWADGVGVTASADTVAYSADTHTCGVVLLDWQSEVGGVGDGCGLSPNLAPAASMPRRSHQEHMVVY